MIVVQINWKQQKTQDSMTVRYAHNNEVAKIKTDPPQTCSRNVYEESALHVYLPGLNRTGGSWLSHQYLERPLLTRFSSAALYFFALDSTSESILFFIRYLKCTPIV